MKTTLCHLWRVLFAAAMPLLSGLAEDSSVQRATEAEVKTDAFRFEVASMRAQVSSTLRQLQLLQKDGSDLRLAFDQYCADLDKMDKVAKQAADRAGKMETNSSAFFQNWEQQVGLIQNKEIRQVAQERYNRRKQSYAKIVTSMDETRKAVTPFVSLLKDIKKLLEIELNQGSIRSANKILAEAKWKGADVEEELYNTIVELDRLSTEFGRYR